MMVGEDGFFDDRSGILFLELLEKDSGICDSRDRQHVRRIEKRTVPAGQRIFFPIFKTAEIYRLTVLFQPVGISLLFFAGNVFRTFAYDNNISPVQA